MSTVIVVLHKSVTRQYFNVKVTYTSGDENKAIEALHCYVTQYTSEEFKEEARNQHLSTIVLRSHS